MEWAGSIVALLVMEGSSIDQLYVRPGWTGQGLGSRLIEFAKARRPVLDLWTFQSNLGARRFYERHGFVAGEATAGDNEERAPDLHYEWRSGIVSGQPEEGTLMRWQSELADALPAGPPPRTQARRLRRLSQTRIALLHNHKPKAARLLELIGEVLDVDYGAQVVKAEFTRALSAPAESTLVASVARDVDLVIVGVGDSGSPSLLTVHDALEVERNGVPAVCVCTRPFGPGVAAMAAMRGAPHLGIALVSHPIVTLDDEGLRARAEEAVPQIISLATTVEAHMDGSTEVSR